MNARGLAVLGALGLLLGAVMPWATITAPLVGTVTIPGYRGDGILTGGLGLVLLLAVMAVQGKPGERYSPLIAIFGALALVLTVPKISSIGGVDTPGAFSEIGIGLWISIIGGVLVAVGGFSKMPGTPVAAPPAAPVVDVAPPSEPPAE